MKDRIKLGRRGVAEGFVSQVYNRWNSSEVGGGAEADAGG